jgi:hypothetical protein
MAWVDFNTMTCEGRSANAASWSEIPLALPDFSVSRIAKSGMTAMLEGSGA